MDEPVYKILTAAEWARAEAEGRFTGSTVDHADGYIHLSTGAQVRETAAKHFAGQSDLVLLSVDPSCLPAAALRWEPSRGGALFPHLYAALPVDSVTRADPLPLGPEGHRFPDTLPG